MLSVLVEEISEFPETGNTILDISGSDVSCTHLREGYASLVQTLLTRYLEGSHQVQSAPLHPHCPISPSASSLSNQPLCILTVQSAPLHPHCPIHQVQSAPPHPHCPISPSASSLSNLPLCILTLQFIKSNQPLCILTVQFTSDTPDASQLLDFSS